MTTERRIAVMGAGSWGTTLAKVCADACTLRTGNTQECVVRLWARREEAARAIQTTRKNSDYLPGIILPDTICVSSNAAEVLEDADIVILAVPSQTVRTNLLAWAPHIPSWATIVSLAKGIEANTLKRMSEVIAEVGAFSQDRIAVLTGPNLAREIALEQPSATVVACRDEDRARGVQNAVAAPYFRPYTNTDVVGCELGGASKNVIALACGIAAGKGLGENTAATLITRGLAEITRLGQACGAHPRTFSGLAGLGDLVATCSSPLSRNRACGVALGQGNTVQQAEHATQGQVAEGVTTSQSLYLLAQRVGVDMPITHAVYSVCHEGVSVDAMMAALMVRTKKAE